MPITFLRAQTTAVQGRCSLLYLACENMLPLWYYSHDEYYQKDIYL